MTEAVAAPQSSPRIADFRQAVQQLRLRASSRRGEPEYYLFLAGAFLTPLGILLILLGWYGASRSPFIFEQVPYLISGGVLGLALTFAGAFAYFAYWIAQVVKQQAKATERTVEAIGRLESLLSQNGHGPPPVETKAFEIEAPPPPPPPKAEKATRPKKAPAARKAAKRPVKKAARKPRKAAKKGTG